MSKMKDRRVTHGMSDHPAYSVWANMVYRCSNPNASDYHKYGGRGIRVCDRWKSFENFWLDMGAGYKQGLTIDRIYPRGNYTPSNCRWTSYSVQNINRHKWAGTSSRFRGVSWHKRKQKWQAYIDVNKRRISLGYFVSEEAAAKAFDSSALQHYGMEIMKATLNFSNS